MESREFYMSYDNGIFHARVLNPSRNTYTPREVGYDLDELFAKCKTAGLTWDGHMTEEAINEVRYRKMQVEPVLNFVDELWRGESTIAHKGKLGFRLPHESS